MSLKTPSVIVDAAYELAQSAIDMGVSVDAVLRELASAWDTVLQEKRKRDAMAFRGNSPY